MSYMTTTTLGWVKKTGLLAVAFTAAFATMSMAATPEKRVPKSKLWLDIGAAERIDFAGRVRMLAQRIAASSCNIAAGVEPEISQGLLAGSQRELNRILSALRFGNPLMKIIGEEDNPRVLAVFSDIEGSWTPIDATITQMLNGNFNDADFDAIEAWNTAFFETANLFVSEIAAEYSDPADLLQRDAILLDVAGRQRMRTQMMLKQSCAIWRDGASPEEQQALGATVEIFEKTLNAMRFGVEDVGLKAAPTEQIEAALEKLGNDWTAIKASMATVAQGRAISPRAMTGIYLGLNDMLIQSERIVAMYTGFAKHDY